MHLARFPRVRLFPTPTPLEKLEHLSRHLGGPEIWIKRDDCTVVATGGNKVRKLEWLVGEARAQGATHLVVIDEASGHPVGVLATTDILQAYAASAAIHDKE